MGCGAPLAQFPATWGSGKLYLPDSPDGRAAVMTLAFLAGNEGQVWNQHVSLWLRCALTICLEYMFGGTRSQQDRSIVPHVLTKLLHQNILPGAVCGLRGQENDILNNVLVHNVFSENKEIGVCVCARACVCVCVCTW
jgi:hypothetical protein